MGTAHDPPPDGETGSADTPPSFRYAAFISYRHADVDRRWAKWLHRVLETYRVPKRLRRERPDVPARIGRCFRDEEELPASADLSREIDNALEESRFLIIVCSPRTPASRWVNREVERFRELGRGDRILALLVDGEPGESFPQALREIRTTVTDASGLSRQQIEQVEPLAADVRPTRHEARGHLGRMARLRIAACLLGVAFDDLRQREQERKTRRLIAAVSAAVALLAVMTGLTIYAFAQRDRADVQMNRASAEAERAGKAEREAQTEAANARREERKAKVALSRNAVDAGLHETDMGNAAAAFLHFTRAAQLDDSPLNGDRVAAFRAALPRLVSGPAWISGNDEVSPDGLRVVRKDLTDANGNSARVFDAITGAAISPRMPHKFFLQRERFSNDGKRVVTAAADSTARVWDAATGQPVSPPITHGGWVQDASFSPDDARIVTGSADKTARVWNATTGAPLTPPMNHENAVNQTAFSPDGMRIITTTEEGAVQLWNAADGRPLSPALSQRPHKSP